MFRSKQFAVKQFAVKQFSNSLLTAAIHFVTATIVIKSAIRFSNKVKPAINIGTEIKTAITAKLGINNVKN